ncbi:hypothetical protein G6F70_006322 [Rhizopus microsporus]|uniref:Uncharacterized protein n=2 Tax=Rhizopus TaxID=4842 RepID=A0A367K106_RHIAZ|nr:hypothetical protein G6F71_003023 [Rhizopus microsporus]RCH95922.1 hypothetical protein CU097_012009 [Rhizopus azygosporus]KAG1197830.1 hypothetical protein G6F70_006322 [Rhizopus microsporus]KAG1209635.1 hypothetical protein G6F69_006182 [Rhizopus microsporus]KAG1231139.1 hypothetical protein G6F67_005965 [Rhizopus microsporus]
MVATQMRSTLSTGLDSQSSSGKSKRRPSYRKTSEKYTTSKNPSSSRPSPANAHMRNVHKRRSRSLCSDIPHVHQDNRRPSAPAVSNVPRLSIAERFMAYGHSSSTSQLVPDTKAHDRAVSPTMTTKSLDVHNSSLSDLPAVGSNGKLSVAERFMNVSVSSPSDSSLSTYAQQYRERSMSTFSGRTLHTATLSSLCPTPDPGARKLSIAETFMKAPSICNPTPAGEKLSVSSIKGSDIPTHYNDNEPNYESSSAHPLDLNQQRLSIFDDPHNFNLDTYLRPTSVLSFTLDNEKPRRPWGSQDTLVQQQIMDKKKLIHDQLMGSNKKFDVFDDTRSAFSKDYFGNPTDYHVTRGDGLSSHFGPGGEYDEHTDIELGYEKAHSYRNYGEDEVYEDDQEDKAGKDHRDGHYDQSEIHAKKRKLQENEDFEAPSGCWLGCCFISCSGQSKNQPSQKQKHNKSNGSRSRKKGCGKKGCVFFTFIFLIVITLTIYFIWPHAPLMRIEGASLTSPPKITETKQGIMVGNVAFESEWLVNITVDNRQNRVPTKLTRVQVIAKDALTGLVIGKGLHNDDPNPDTITLAPGAISIIQIPIHVDYQARETTDTTFVDLIKACSPRYAPNVNDSLPPGQHEALPLHFWITLHFYGMDWLGYKPTLIAAPATGGFVCPQ